MVTPKHVIVFEVNINGLTFFKPESLAVTKVSFILDIMYQCDL